METLKEKEWITLNKVILEIYSIKTMEEFASHILKICRNLVPYDMGYFLIYDETEAVREETGYSAAEGMDDELFSVYLKEYYAKDYLQYFISLFKESACYRDTDIMDERLRTKTEIFCHFMEPNGIPYGAGCVLWKGNQMLGVLNFFRSETLGDFTDKEMFILNLLQDHLAEKMVRFADRMGLTARERESFTLLMDGKSNQEIADDLSISLSTVKKHVVNIFDKCHVGSRSQLRQAYELQEN